MAKTSNKVHSNVWQNRLRSVSTVILIIITVLAISGFVVVHWAEKQILNTDNWVALVSPLPKQPVVSDALGGYIGQQVFSSVNVEQEIASALPPKASFLASPIASQVKSITVSTSQKIVASDFFQTIWTGANRIAMNSLLSQARGQPTPLQSKLKDKFSINISGVSGGLSSALGSAAQAIPALQPAKQKILDVTTSLHASVKKISQVIKTLDFLNAVLPFLIIASFLAALALANHRRKLVIIASVSVIIFMLIEIIALNWLKQETLNQVHNSANLSAVGYIYDTLVNTLRHMINLLIVIMLILIGLLVLGGPAKWAKSARSLVHMEKIKNSQFVKSLQSVRRWAKHWEYYLWLAVFILVLAIVALSSSISGKDVVNALLILISLISLIHIIATKRSTVTNKLR